MAQKRMQQNLLQLGAIGQATLTLTFWFTHTHQVKSHEWVSGGQS